MHLTTEQHGAYLLLIMAYWKNGGAVSSSDQSLAATCRLSPDAWSMHKHTLASFFDTQTDPSLWIHERAEREMEKAGNNQQKRTLRAQTAAAARWGNNAPGNAPSNAKSIPQAMLSECPSPSPSPTYKKQDQKTCPKPKGLDGFDDFWKIYPRKESKATARKAWEKIKESYGLLEIILAAVEQKKGTVDWIKEGGKFVPLPASWLNARRWEDETPKEAQISVKAMNKILDIYNEVCQGRFQPASGITDSRASELASLWHTKFDEQAVFQSAQGWAEYFHRCLKTNFSWVAKEEINFDFLISKGNVARVWECHQ